MVLTVLRSARLTTAFRPSSRFRLDAFFVRMWLLKAFLWTIFFFAVTWNLFFAPLWVFNFGIFHS